MIKIKNVSNKIIGVSVMSIGSGGVPVATAVPVMPDEVKEFEDGAAESIKILQEMGLVKVAKAKETVQAAPSIASEAEQDKPTVEDAQPSDEASTKPRKASKSKKTE